jgi:hypothetical protein
MFQSCRFFDGDGSFPTIERPDGAGAGRNPSLNPRVQHGAVECEFQGVVYKGLVEVRIDDVQPREPRPTHPWRAYSRSRHEMFREKSLLV